MKWRFVGKAAGGITVKGEVEAASSQEAVELVRQRNVMPLRIEHKQELADIWMGWKGVKVEELAMFTRQLATMLSSGLTLTEALGLLKIQSSPALVKVVGQVLDDISAGSSLSAAMAKHKKVFSRVFVSMVAAGEAGGVLETTLERLAEATEKEREFKSKVGTALVYPGIILAGMVVVMGIILVVVVPKLRALYDDVGQQLPLLTRVTVGVSEVVIGLWWAVLALTIAAGAAVRSYLATPIGRYQWSRIVYKIPIFGSLAYYVMLKELTGTLALLVGTGVSVVEALRIVAAVGGNAMVEEEVKKIAQRVEKGFPVSICFAESAVFPPVVGQMAAVGEETGKMDEVMARISKYFEVNSENRIRGLTAALEPIILVVLAVGIGFLMFAILLPIYDIVNKI